MNIMGREVHTSVFLADGTWLRRPKSKKKRINKKWDKLYTERYFLSVPSKQIIMMKDKIIVHPSMLPMLEDLVRRQNEQTYTR
jgi:hypothetical protein